MNRMGIVFIILSALIVAISLALPKEKEETYISKKGIFKTDSIFNMLSIGILVILAFLYSYFW